ncbi:MAG: hypothetical protein ACR2LC_09480 [Pyrinomonadaceae bacterium]
MTTIETSAQIKARNIEILSTRDDVSREKLAAMTLEYSEAHNKEAAARYAARYPDADGHNEATCIFCRAEAAQPTPNPARCAPVEMLSADTPMIHIATPETGERIGGILL